MAIDPNLIDALRQEAQRRLLAAELEKRKSSSLLDKAGSIFGRSKALDSIVKPVRDVVTSAPGEALGAIDRFTRAVEDTPVPGLPALQRIARGDIKEALWFDPQEEKSTVRLGDPKRVVGEAIRENVPGAPGSIASGATDVLLDPTNLLGIGLVGKAGKAGRTGGRLTNAAAEIIGRGSLSKKQYLTMLGASGAGAAAGGEVGGTPGSLIGGFAGGWGGLAGLSRARRLRREGMLEAARTNEQGRNLDGLQDEVADGIRKSENRYRVSRTADGGEVKEITQDGLSLHLSDRNAAAAVKQSQLKALEAQIASDPGNPALQRRASDLKASIDEQREATSALESVMEFMYNANRSALYFADEYDIGRVIRNAGERAADIRRLTLDQSQANQRLATFEDAASRLPDFRFEEEQRGSLGSLFRRELRQAPGSVEGQIAQVRDLDLQYKANQDAAKQQRDVVKAAKQAQKQATDALLGQMPSGGKSAARNYIHALIRGEDVEGALANLQRKAPGVDPASFGSVVDAYRAASEQESMLADLLSSGKESESLYKSNRREMEESFSAEFGRAATALKDRIVQIPGRPGRYRIQAATIQNGKPAVALEYIKPSKTVEEILESGAEVREQGKIAAREKLAEVKELRAEQARLRKAGDEQGASNLVEAIREAEAEAKRLSEPARPRSLKDMPQAERRLVVPLDDAREFIVSKPGKSGTPAALARAGFKDARTVTMLNRESALRTKNEDLNRNLENLQIERENILSKTDQRELQLVAAGMPSSDEQLKLATRLQAVDENIAGLEATLRVNEADLDAINQQILNSQQALEATLAAARDEAEQVARMLDDARVQEEEAWRKVNEALNVTPEDAAFQYLNRQREINNALLESLEGRLSKRLTQAAYEQELQNLDEFSAREFASLNRPQAEALGNFRNQFARALYNMGDKAAINRMLTPLANTYRHIDPDAAREGLLGWLRRDVSGTGARSTRAEGLMATIANQEQAAAQMADLDYGSVKRGIARMADNYLSKAASGNVKLPEYKPQPGRQIFYHGSSRPDITSPQADMFLTPNIADAEVYARADARLEGGEPNIYQFEADPAALRMPEDASGTAVSRDAMRVADPSRVKMLPSKASEAAWARSVQALKTPQERLAATLKRAAKPITSKEWQDELRLVPEGDRQAIYDLLSDKLEIFSRNPNLMDSRYTDASLAHSVRQYGQQAKGVREMSGVKGIVRNLLKSEYRDYTPTGRIQNADGSVTVIPNKDRTIATDLYEVMQNARMDPKRSVREQLTGRAEAVPQLADMIVPGTDWEVTLAANMLDKIGKDGVWRKLADDLKDPKAVEILKQGRALQPNEWKDPLMAEDWPKLRQYLIPDNAAGMWEPLDKAARTAQRIAASTIIGDGSFATVQGLIGAAVSPFRTARMLSDYLKYARTDEGFAMWLADTQNYNDVVDLANRGLGMGRSSMTGVDSAENVFQSIPGLKRAGNAMAALDRITFDRMQLMNKVNAVRTMEADLQMMRMFGPEVSKEFIDGIPTLKTLNESVDIFQSTPDQVRNAIVRQVNNTLGGLGRSQTLLSRNRQNFESLLLFVPGFFRARAGLINSMSKMLRNPNSPEGYLAASILAREMTFRLAFGASIAAATGSLDEYEKEIRSMERLDPRKAGGMLSGPLGESGGYLGLSWGNQAPKLYAQLIAGTTPGEISLDPMQRLEAMTSLFEGRANPVIGTIVDQARGEDFMGRPVESVRDRIVNVLGATTPLFISNTVEEINEADYKNDIDPKNLAAQTAAEFFGINRRAETPREKLANRFTRWQEENYPGSEIIEWSDAPSAFKQMAREDEGIAEAEEEWIADISRRASQSRSVREVIYRSWDERNAEMDNTVARASAELDAGKISAEDFRRVYSAVQEDRADVAATMRETLAKAGVEAKDEVATLGGRGPLIAQLAAEYNAVKPQPRNGSFATEAGFVPDTEIDWTRYKREQAEILARYPQEVVAEFQATKQPEDPNVQRLQGARQVLDTYFDQMPKYRGLSNVEGKALDGYKAVLFQQEQALRDAGINLPRERAYRFILQKMEQDGEISNPRQAQLAALAMRMALDSDMAKRSRNLGAIEFLLANPEVFEWYPWLEAELPREMLRFLPWRQVNTAPTFERELRGSQLSEVR